MTYLIEGRMDVPPTISEKHSPESPRSSALKSVSFPRLRSYPIQTPSAAFQRRGR